MFTFKMDFDSDGIRKKVVAAVKEKIRSKLAAAGLAGRVKVTYTEDVQGFPSKINLSGSEEDVAKAKQVLDIKES
jgi:hypothetical protein